MNIAKNYLKYQIRRKIIKYILILLLPLVPYLLALLFATMSLFIFISLPASTIWTDEGLPSDLVSDVYRVRDEVKNANNIEYYPASYIFAIDNIKRENTYEENKVILPIEEYQKTVVEGKVIDQEQLCEVYNFTETECESLDMGIKLWDNTQIDSPKISGQFVYPVHEPYVITAPFADVDDVHTTPHSGVDFVPIGDNNIYSISNGEVIYTNMTCPQQGSLNSSCPSDQNSTNYQMGYTGNSILVKSDLEGIPIYIVYAHLSEVSVKVGDNVTPDQPIGVIGNSGSSTGTHLHLGIRYEYNSSKYSIDPMPLLSKEATVLPKPTSEQQGFMASAGISESDYIYVNYIITRESNWDVNKKNFFTGGVGLCQASPPELMKKFGDDYMTNPVTQLKYCNEYTVLNYGTWKQAYDYYSKNNHW